MVSYPHAEALASLRSERPGLWADTCIEISTANAQAMRDFILAVEEVARLPGYLARILEQAPTIATIPRLARGVFFGYDFHLTAEGPRLIEINTNAGGAFAALPLILSAVARNTGRAPSCGDISATEVASAIVDMFRTEWKLERGNTPLRRIAIIDESPETQFLYPEFVLCKNLLMGYGIDAVITDPSTLTRKNGALFFGDLPIDLVYNRLTDFYFEKLEHTALRDAYIANEALFTPHPRAHAVLADKENLVVFGDEKQLREWGASERALSALSKCLLPIRRVTQENADLLWSERRHLFFKPLAGYGGKAVYRGDKLTKRVWEDIRTNLYVAQAWAPPAEHAMQINGENVVLRYDVRNYVYNGQVLMLAARLYQGQTTNFRTPGGGFAPVFFPGNE